MANFALGLTILSGVYVVATIVGLHFVRRDLCVLSSPISEYAVGRHGRWMTSALGIWAVAAAALGVGVWLVLPKSAYRLATIAFVGGLAVGLAIAALFPMDLPFPPPRFHPAEFSGTGLLHIGGATLATICCPLAGVMLHFAMKADPQWQPVAALVLAPAVLSAVLTATFFIVSMVRVEYFGLTQRAFAAVDLIWLIVVATVLLRPAGE